jgi:hypothetical protein
MYILLTKGAPTYYLIDSVLFETVVLSAMIDVHISVLSTAISLLTILLPIVAFKAVNRFNQLIAILLGAVRWEIYLPLGIGKDGYSIDKEFMPITIQAISRCVDHYFTVLYGMFPSNVLQHLSRWFENHQWPVVNVQGFESVKSNLTLPNSNPNEIKICQNRFYEMLNSHVISPNLLKSTQQEFDTPWFLELEASETMIDCFKLRLSQEQIYTRIELLDSFDNLSRALLEIHGKLHGHLSHELSKNQIDYDAAIKIHFYTLLNDAFFKECMRQYHMMHIKRLRKKILISDANSINIDHLVSKPNIRMLRYKQKNRKFKSCYKNPCRPNPCSKNLSFAKTHWKVES